MGKRSEEFSISLKQQAYKKLQSMCVFGISKKEYKEQHPEDPNPFEGKIFSYNAYNTYWKHIRYFINYVEDKNQQNVDNPNYKKCTTLKSARKYIAEFLEQREVQGLSAWTVQTEAKAINKLYGITPKDFYYYTPPKRVREEIKRSRGPKANDAFFNEANNEELVNFVCGVGPRRAELYKIKPENLYTYKQLETLLEKTKAKQSSVEDKKESKKKINAIKDALAFKDKDYFVYLKGKGGRIRYSPIIGPHKKDILDRFSQTTKGKRLWEYVPKNADIHSYRAKYATSIYREYARDIEEIPFDKVNKGTNRQYQSEVYTCRKDESGKKLDKAAMKLCTKALGHNRIQIVAENYIRGI